MTRNYLDILAETIRNNWDQPALTDFYLTEDGTAQDTSRGNHYTYGEMYAEICRVANLLTSLGLQKGDHIAICGANSAHWVIAYLAIAKMQGVSVTVMHTLMPEEIARLIAFSDAKALFTDPDLWPDLSPLSAGEGQGVRCISLSDWSLLDGCSDRETTERQPSDDRDISFPQSAPDDLAMICFTSGTSGTAKGVMIPYRSLSNNIRNFHIRFAETSNKNYINFLPFSHMTGLVAELLIQLIRGKQMYIYHGNQTISHIYTSLQIVKPYMFAEIPQIIVSLLNKFGYDVLKEFKQILTGATSFDKKAEENLLALNMPLVIGYGLTEVGATISISFCGRHRLLSSGILLENMTARISPAGEILVKGENVMLGYYKDPEATARKIDSDGWLHTGDKGHLDEDGYLYVEGRLEQDIIVLPNGENIRPDNIESLINALPEVSESIVLARDGKLVAIVVPSSEYRETSETRASSPSSSLRCKILRAINPQLPLFSQLYDVEITDTPLARTEKKTIKRYIYS